MEHSPIDPIIHNTTTPEPKKLRTTKHTTISHPQPRRHRAIPARAGVLSQRARTTGPAAGAQGSAGQQPIAAAAV